MSRYGLLLAMLASGSFGVAHANEFNPNISVHFDGLYYHDTLHGEGAALLAPGHAHDDHAHEGLSNGFNLQETEVAVWGTVDPLFDAWLGVVAHADGDVGIEEAWIRTRAMPAGLQLKAGKFLSAVGYHNEKHLHEWAFADQNLAYARLLGDHGLLDTGAQLNWLAPTPWYLLMGAELLQGEDRQGFGSRVDAHELEDASLTDEPDHFHKDGPGVAVLFARTGPDLGVRHALQFGASWAHQRSSGTWLEDDLAASKGDSDLYGLQFVYKRFADGAYDAGRLSVQGEWFLLDTDERIALSTDPLLLGLPVRRREQAAYLQATWGFAPRWSAGVRTAVAGLDADEREADHSHEVDPSYQHSLALTWQATEFSRVRLQFTHNDLAGDDDHGHGEQFNQVMLQYSLSLGAHGAHAF